MEPTRRAFMAATVASLITLPSCMSARAADRERREERREDRRDDTRREEPRRDAGRWEKLGERRVGKKEEHDAIELDNKHRFTAVWFEVERGTIDLDDIEITFGNNEKFNPGVKLTFHEGEKTRLIDLPGADREIIKIRFHYRSVGRGEATIVAWGRAAEGHR
jgi:hypothetical protein